VGSEFARIAAILRGSGVLSDSPLVNMRGIESGKVRVTRELFGAD
jgi:hypothetical protein